MNYSNVLAVFGAIALIVMCVWFVVEYIASLEIEEYLDDQDLKEKLENLSVTLLKERNDE